jgi:hypothetical protein
MYKHKMLRTRLTSGQYITIRHIKLNLFIRKIFSNNNLSKRIKENE